MDIQTTVYLVTGLKFALPFLPDEAEVDRDQLMRELRGEFPSAIFVPTNYKDSVDLSQVATPRLMLVGHSFGGDRCLTWIEQSPGKRVDRLFLLDSVPDDTHVSRRYSADYQFEIPENVAWACNFRRSQRFRWPFSKSIHTDRPGLAEYRVEEGHGAFYRNSTVIAAIRAGLAELSIPLVGT